MMRLIEEMEFVSLQADGQMNWKLATIVKQYFFSNTFLQHYA